MADIHPDIMQNYNYPGSSVDQINEIYNAQFLSDNTGVRYFPNEKIKSPTQVQKILKTLIQRYYDAMTKGEYGNLKLIDSYPKVQQYVGKLGFYDQQLADNQAKIDLIEGTIGQLNTLQTRIDHILNAVGPDDSDPQFKKVRQQFETLIPDLDVSPYISKKGK